MAHFVEVYVWQAQGSAAAGQPGSSPQFCPIINVIKQTIGSFGSRAKCLVLAARRSKQLPNATTNTSWHAALDWLVRWTVRPACGRVAWPIVDVFRPWFVRGRDLGWHVFSSCVRLAFVQDESLFRNYAYAHGVLVNRLPSPAQAHCDREVMFLDKERGGSRTGCENYATKRASAGKTYPFATALGVRTDLG